MIEELLDKEKKSVGELVCLCILIFVLLIAVLGDHFFSYTCVDGGSMENSLQNGQYVITLCDGFTAKRGDIVIIDREWYNGEKVPLIKRVVATGGDKLLFMYSSDRQYMYLYICKNGESHYTLYEEPYIKAPMLAPSTSYSFVNIINYFSGLEDIALDGDSPHLAEIARCEVVIEKNHFFFMGDNRNGSLDSRNEYGIFDCKYIKSKAIKILPINGFIQRSIEFLFTPIQKNKEVILP